jgi:hypothetical protein
VRNGGALSAAVALRNQALALEAVGHSRKDRPLDFFRSEERKIRTHGNRNAVGAADFACVRAARVAN